MEKLQKALQQARDRRAQDIVPDTGAAGAHARSVRPTPDPKTNSVDAAWQALTGHEPDPERLIQYQLVSLQAQPSATPFDILRTKTQLMMRKNGWSRLAITSPTASCGKTTLACNLALGFTRQTDVRVVLVEMDLRRPALARMLGVTPEKDVVEVMRGTVDVGEQAIRVRDNVAFLLARQPLADPTSILLSQKTKTVLAAMEETYRPDLVIFDLPPVLVGDDTRAFLKEVDCALLVAKAESTSVSQIDVCEREVAEQTNVLGVVLNQCRHVSDTDYSYGGYGTGS